MAACTLWAVGGSSSAFASGHHRPRTPLTKVVELALRAVRELRVVLVLLDLDQLQDERAPGDDARPSRQEVSPHHRLQHGALAGALQLGGGADMVPSGASGPGGGVRGLTAPIPRVRSFRATPRTHAPRLHRRSNSDGVCMGVGGWAGASPPQAQPGATRASRSSASTHACMHAPARMGMRAPPHTCPPMTTMVDSLFHSRLPSLMAVSPRLVHICCNLVISCVTFSMPAAEATMSAGSLLGPLLRPG